MADIFRDAPAGHLIRFLAGNDGKLLTYSDETAPNVPGYSTPQNNNNGTDNAEKQDAESTPGTTENIVEWYHDNDQDNPQNWSLRKKIFVLVQIMLLNFSGKFGCIDGLWCKSYFMMFF